jgi:hypothetical protein
METKEMKIQVPDGYKIDRENSTFEKIVFKKVDDLPKSWEELGEIKGWYVDSFSNLMPYGEGRSNKNDDKNVFPTKEEAEACLALAQLCQLRDRYNDGWKPNWNDGTDKYSIYFTRDEIDGVCEYCSHRVLAFKTLELRDKFVENFKDLIETAKPLL